MAKKRLLAVEIESSGSNEDLNQKKDFILHVQDALLLALLEQEQLTQGQYQRCIAELRRQQSTGSSQAFPQ